MTFDDCYFTTERLVVGSWSRVVVSDQAPDSRVPFVASLLTGQVTRDLPPEWQGAFDAARSTSWIADREAESSLLFAADRSSRKPVGVLILAEATADGGGRDVRVGYIISDQHWGKGLATEVVAGAIEWCRNHTGAQRLVGGVSRSASASAKVLEKNGFIAQPSIADTPEAGIEYQREL